MIINKSGLTGPTQRAVNQVKLIKIEKLQEDWSVSYFFTLN